MHSVWRSVFIWLLVLAMPVQGLAAAGMQHCAPTHERMAAPGLTAQATQAHAHMHGPADSAPTAANGAAAPEPAHDEHAAATADLKCSACAACCPALGLPAAALEWPEMPGAPGLAQPRLRLVPSFVPGGLDRPPRDFLA